MPPTPRTPTERPDRSIQITHKKHQPNDMYCITRGQNNGKYLSWRLVVFRRGLTINKTFTDLKWGGKEQALAAAKQHRDALIQLIAPLTMRENAQKVKSNNSTGVAGVSCTKYNYGYSWLARISISGRKTITKAFPESIYGTSAREMAIQARMEMLNLLDETSTVKYGPTAIALTNPVEFPIKPTDLSRRLTVRVQRIIIKRQKTKANIYARVSDGVKPPIYKVYSITPERGEESTFCLAMQATLMAVKQLGGKKVAKTFARDYFNKYKQLPEQGISAKLYFTPNDHIT